MTGQNAGLLGTGLLRLVGLVSVLLSVLPMPAGAAAARPPDAPGRITPVRPIPIPADVTLRAGQTVTLDGGSLRLWFVGVDEDDRCPPEVECEWPGRAVIRLRVTVDQVDRGEVAVALYAAPQPPPEVQYGAVVEIDRYVISLVDLQPYPTAGLRTPPLSYVATLRVSSR